MSLGLSIALVLVGLAALVGGGQALVSGAKSIAEWFGMPERIIALTLVAGGTSLPELATSVVAARKGEGDIALGNLVGSNIFNILMILGLVAATRTIDVDADSLSFDFPAMTIMQALCLPIMLSRMRVSRVEGIVLLLAYGAYCAVAFGGVLD
jgi:cation:H+ antiporter